MSGVETRPPAADARRIMSSDSVPHPANAPQLAGVFAEALRNEDQA